MTKKSGTITGCKNIDVCGTAIVSPAFVQDRSWSASLVIREHASSACIGGEKNGLRGLRQRPARLVRSQDTPSPRFALREHVNLPGIEDSPRRLQAVRRNIRFGYGRLYHGNRVHWHSVQLSASTNGFRPAGAAKRTKASMTLLKMILSVLGGSLMLLQLGPLPLMAANYYVSTTGAATWANCSGSTPLSGASACSWQTAMANAVADDIVYFRGGTYNLGPLGSQRDYPTMRPINSGTLGHPITFIAYPGETPDITGTNPGTVDKAAYFGCGHTDYATWDGFSATMQVFGVEAAQMVGFWNTTGCILKNGNFTGTDVGSNGNNVSPVHLDSCTNCEVYNNRIHDMLGTAYVNNTSIWIFGSTGVRIHHNTFTHSVKAVDQKTGPNIDNWIYNNFIYDMRDDGMFLREQAATGTGIKVFNNVIVNANGGINITGTGTADRRVNDYQIYNNTYYGTGVGIQVGDHQYNAQVWNNIISGPSSPLLRYYTTGGGLPSYSDYNDFYPTVSTLWNLNYATNYTTIADWRTATGFDTKSITSNPLFVNAGGNKPEDYKLQAASPARISGRGGAYASVMGAYITGTECIGIASNCQPPPTASIPPARPRGLRLQ